MPDLRHDSYPAELRGPEDPRVRAMQVACALEQLPLRQAQAVRLIYGEHLSQDLVAARLRTSLDVVKREVALALQSLAALLCDM